MLKFNLVQNNNFALRKSESADTKRNWLDYGGEIAGSSREAVAAFAKNSQISLSATIFIFIYH